MSSICSCWDPGPRASNPRPRRWISHRRFNFTHLLSLGSSSARASYGLLCGDVQRCIDRYRLHRFFDHVRFLASPDSTYQMNTPHRQSSPGVELRILSQFKLFIFASQSNHNTTAVGLWTAFVASRRSTLGPRCSESIHSPPVDPKSNKLGIRRDLIIRFEFETMVAVKQGIVIRASADVRIP